MLGKFVSVALLATALTSGTALAADPPINAKKAQARTEKLFPKADRNKDGFVTVEEWIADGYKVDKFTFVDTDKNGRITVKEFLVAQAFCDHCF